MPWLILSSGILNLILGFIVWLRNPKDKLNYGFAVFSTTAFVLIFLDFLFRFYPNVFILRSSYAVATLIPATALFWILEMCEIKFYKLSKLINILIALPTIFFFILVYINGYVVKDVYQLTSFGYRGNLGPAFIAYSFYFLIYISILIGILYFSQKKSDLIKKQQIRFVLLGILSYGACAAFFSLVLPTAFDIFNFTLLDAPSLILFVGFTTYAILKLHLFNIKVITTEIFVFALVIFILIRTILSNSLEDKLTNGGLLLLSIILGLLIIRSVIKEVEQRERIQSLATDLSKANADMEKANEKLKELDQLKSEFVSLATHQIRAPLTAIKGYVSLIEEGDYGPVSKEVSEALDVVHKSTDNLVAIVGDFLDVSRIEQGRMKYDFKDFDVEQLTQQVVTEYKPNVEKRGLKLNYSSEQGKNYMTYADLGKIKQVIGNIIDNSIKYTPVGHINISVGKPSDDKILIKVADTGVGISPKVMPKLFQKFSRAADASDVNILGTGLGLYVAKQMIDAHHGRIWAESKGEKQGSQFYIELPVNKTV